MGQTALLPPKKFVLLLIIALNNPLLMASFEPANLGVNFKHDNHYTTDKTS
jgi:hypothetical protein